VQSLEHRQEKTQATISICVSLILIQSFSGLLISLQAPFLHRLYWGLLYRQFLFFIHAAIFLLSSPQYGNPLKKTRVYDFVLITPTFHAAGIADPQNAVIDWA
jgi:hypothetical protein